MEGDIAACFDSFDHHVLIALLRKRIDDEKLIALMWKFLKAGYSEQWVYHQTYSGTPQGSGISPVLANIYLHELDTLMEEYQTRFSANNVVCRKTNKAYGRLKTAAHVYKRGNMEQWHMMSKEERTQHANNLREMKKKMRQLPSREFRDTSFKTLRYTRYADDFIIGVIGSKADAEKIKADIGAFLSEKLHLTLSAEKTTVIHATQCARFLGYDISIGKGQSVKKQENGTVRRVHSGNVILRVPHEKWASKLREYGAIRINTDDQGKDHWRAIHRGGLITRTDIEILARYNSEVRGLYNYYSIAHNACALGRFGGLMKYSMLRTFAGKYRTTVNKIIARYVHNGNFTVSYPTRKGMKQSIFYNGGYKRKRLPVPGLIDTLPAYTRYDRVNSLAARLRAKTCELCGIADCELEMHQVKRLKDLRGAHSWELVMLNKRRKTLAVCHECHEKIHSCD